MESDSGQVVRKPLRVLHVVGRMGHGGVESWLMQILRNAPRDEIEMDFLVGDPKPGEYDAEIRALGSNILQCEIGKNPWGYVRRFRNTLSQVEPYDVVHSHVHHFSGIVLWAARRSGVQRRIAHSHSDQRVLEDSTGIIRKLYLKMMKSLIARVSTSGVAVSNVAAESLYGVNWRHDHRKVLYCGIDLTPFRAAPSRDQLRGELSIPIDATVIGHVGRFVQQKNHVFVVQVFAEILRQAPSANPYLLLVGEGPLQTEIRELVERLGLSDRVLFLNRRRDVPHLFTSVFDVFLLPSLLEGLPLVALEAQAAGVPTVLSTSVTSEAAVIPSLVAYLGLNAPIQQWAERVLMHRRKRMDLTSSMRLLEDSKMNVRQSMRALLELYKNG